MEQTCPQSSNASQYGNTRQTTDETYHRHDNTGFNRRSIRDLTESDLDEGRMRERHATKDTRKADDDDSDDDSNDDLSSCSDGDNYKAGTTDLLDRIQELWQRYCVRRGKDWRESLEHVLWRDLYKFFNWSLKQVRGKDGRRLRGTKCASSLGTNWKYFRLMYERAMGEKLDAKCNRQMHKGLHKLTRKYNLSVQTREKPLLFAEELFLVSQTTLRTTEKRFDLGRTRIELCFYFQLGAFTVNRNSAILALQYRHIVVTLLRDPAGGPHRLLLEFTFEFTKQYLGMKEANTFPIPEIIYDASLILSPHVFLLGLIFADKAFKAPSLTSPEQLSKLEIGQGRNQLPLPLDPRAANHYLFCKTRKTFNGVEVLHDQKLPLSTLSPRLKAIGEITGLLQVVRGYVLRYGGASEIENSGLVSDSQRNLIMMHSDTRTFLKHYLSRRIENDLQSIYRGLDPQTEIMRAATRMGRYIDRRRPRELTTQQKASVDQDPEIKDLIRGRDCLMRLPSARCKGTKEYHQLQNLKQEVIKARSRRAYALLKESRQSFDNRQAVIDIERQLSGGAVDEAVEEKLAAEGTMLPQQIHLLEKLTTRPTSLSLEAEWRRRSEAINAVTAYCHVQEGGSQRGRKPKQPGPPSTRPVSRNANTETQPSTILEETSEHLGQAKRPEVCFLCYGNPRLSVDRRVKRYGRPQDLTRHFRRNHLERINGDERVECGLCGTKLEHKMHLQNHARTAHRTHS